MVIELFTQMLQLELDGLAPVIPRLILSSEVRIWTGMLEDVSGAANMPEPPSRLVQFHDVMSQVLLATNTTGDVPRGWPGVGNASVFFEDVQKARQCCFEKCTLSIGTRAIQCNVFRYRPNGPIQLTLGYTDAIGSEFQHH